MACGAVAIFGNARRHPWKDWMSEEGQRSHAGAVGCAGPAWCALRDTCGLRHLQSHDEASNAPRHRNALPGCTMCAVRARRLAPARVQQLDAGTAGPARRRQPNRLIGLDLGAVTLPQGSPKRNPPGPKPGRVNCCCSRAQGGKRGRGGSRQKILLAPDWL